MKKIGYLFMGLMVMILGMNGVEAKDAPTFSSTLETSTGTGNNVNIGVTVKNTVTTCNDTGVKNGYVYIYLKDDELFAPANLSGIAVYRNYNESTQSFTESNVLCSYDSTEKAVKCNFGRVNTTPSLINYSDCKDEMKINFTSEMCAGKTDCTIRVVVKGQAIDYNNGNPISISAGTTVLHDKSYTCSGTSSSTIVSNDPVNNDPVTDIQPTEGSNTEVENPNTLDSTSMYFIIGIVSFVFMCVLLKPDKKTRRA